MSAWTIVYLGGSALGPIFGGYAIGALGPKNAFLIVGAAGLCGAALFPLLRLLAGLHPLPAGPQPGDGGLEPPVHVP